MREKLTKSVGNILDLQQRSIIYFKIKNAQQELISQYIFREKMRMMNLFVKGDPI